MAAATDILIAVFIRRFNPSCITVRLSDPGGRVPTKLKKNAIAKAERASII
jgi:hypothetical protein